MLHEVQVMEAKGTQIHLHFSMYFFLTNPDINECSSESDTCDDINAECINTYGSYDCACQNGFHKQDEGALCKDIDECLTGEDECLDELAVCENLPGSYGCSCLVGYEGDGMNSCDGKAPEKSCFSKIVKKF